MEKKFKRVKEDFVCENCEKTIKGNGYTNHCPFCLCSKHVDINPGDRLCECKGIMDPISITVKRDNYTILHKCRKCGFEKNQKSSPDDDINKIIEISKINK